MEVHTQDAAGWHALVTRAEAQSQICLQPAVSGYVVALLWRFVGTPGADWSAASARLVDQYWRGATGDAANPCAVADQCLLFAGLFPDQAAEFRVPVTELVDVGAEAYFEYGLREGQRFFLAMSDAFVPAMDVLQTMRAGDLGRPPLDLLTVFQLWRDSGSHRAWELLQRRTSALPVAHESSFRH